MTKRNLALKFCTYLQTCNDEEYFFSSMCAHLAPVTHGLKVGSIMTLKNEKRSLLSVYMSQKTHVEKSFSLDSFVLKKNQNSAIVYFYKKEKLLNLLKDESICGYLSKLGYQKREFFVNEFAHLNHLSKRFESSCPSEVGIFLGYPLCDVIDFSYNQKPCKCVGYWKCYNDDKKARQVFKRFDYAKIKEIKRMIS